MPVKTRFADGFQNWKRTRYAQLSVHANLPIGMTSCPFMPELLTYSKILNMFLVYMIGGGQSKTEMN
jgi:hypothetical protein